MLVHQLRDLVAGQPARRARESERVEGPPAGNARSQAAASHPSSIAGWDFEKCELYWIRVNDLFCVREVQSANAPIHRKEAASMRDDPPGICLVTRAQTGDQQAWDLLVERYAPLVWSICRRYRLGGPDAEDVGQNVWLRLADQLDRIRDPAALPGPAGHHHLAGMRQGLAGAAATARRRAGATGQEHPRRQGRDGRAGTRERAVRRSLRTGTTWTDHHLENHRPDRTRLAADPDNPACRSSQEAESQDITGLPAAALARRPREGAG